MIIKSSVPIVSKKLELLPKQWTNWKPETFLLKTKKFRSVKFPSTQMIYIYNLYILILTKNSASPSVTLKSLDFWMEKVSSRIKWPLKNWSLKLVRPTSRKLKDWLTNAKTLKEPIHVHMLMAFMSAILMPKKLCKFTKNYRIHYKKYIFPIFKFSKHFYLYLIMKIIEKKLRKWLNWTQRGNILTDFWCNTGYK